MVATKHDVRSIHTTHIQLEDTCMHIYVEILTLLKLSEQIRVDKVEAWQVRT